MDRRTVAPSRWARSNGQVDLRQLRYFLAVVEEGGVRRAAQKLYVAQPGVTRALHQLEQELGVELLQRTSGGVEATDAGREFALHAHRMLEQEARAKAAMRERASRGRTLRIGVVAGILGAGELTAPILHGHRAAHPDLDTSLIELSFCDQSGPLLDGRLDVALVRGPLAHPGLDVAPIALERRALLVASGHELAGEPEVDVQDALCEHTLALGSPDDWSGFWQLDDMRGAAHVAPQVAPATTIPGMQLAVANTRMVITVPHAMGRLAPNPLVRCIALRGAEPSTIAVARRRGDRRAEVSGFIDQAGLIAERHIALLAGGALPG
jgi:DNA-binding transcriptional LysR family regulator